MATNQISAEQAAQLYQNSTAQNQNMAKLYQGQASKPSATTSYRGPSAEEQKKMAEAAAEALEAKRKEEEEKQRQLTEKKNQWQGAIDRIQNSAAIADESTIKQGINESDAGKYIGTGIGKSRMANASEANTAYELSDYINQNKQMNRTQSLSQAVTNAEDLLKAFGFEDTALYNKEAGDLQNQAQGELNFANIVNTIMQTTHDYLGKIK